MLDVTVALRPGYVPLYPNDTPLEPEHVQSLAAGDPRTVSRLQCSVHAGTHVDGPAHYLRGAPGVEAVPLDALIGRCCAPASPWSRPWTCAAPSRAGTS